MRKEGDKVIARLKACMAPKFYHLMQNMSQMSGIGGMHKNEPDYWAKVKQI